ncbi:MAG: anthranilate synthase component I [bacterium]|nr:anthranilate synthase component I [bacterium]
MKLLSFEQVNAFSKEYSFVPVSQEVYCDMMTPISLMRKLAEKSEHYFLLESVVNGKDIGRYSFLGYDPRMRVYCKDKKVFYCVNNETKQLEGEPIQVMKRFIKEYRAPKIEGLPTFAGGFVGYFSYEMISLAEPKLVIKESEFPQFDLMFYDRVIAFDHLKQKVCIIANVELEKGRAAYEAALKDIERMAKEVVDQMPIKKCIAQEKVEFSCNMSKEQFCNMVNQVKAHIKEGDVFQTVVSRRFEADYESSLINTYRVMRTINPSPYMYYLKSQDIEIAGVSPETLVKLIDGTLTTFPVAGTRKRGDTVQEDKKLEIELLQDPKELAEHNMLVDLARNDIGRLSELGSVKVEEYMQIHRFSKVMHIASVVTGRLREDKDAMDTITTMLPAGTLSGAPKFRACELIDELEQDPRGVYAGAIGYLDMSGNADVCIGIRTAVKKDNKVYVQAGAGIVADSDPEEEYEESYNKAKAVLEAIMKASEVNGL